MQKPNSFSTSNSGKPRHCFTIFFSRLLFCSLVLSFALLSFGCNTKPQPEVKPALPPEPALVEEVPPKLRTSEENINFTGPLQSSSPADIEFSKQGLSIAKEKQTVQLISAPIAITLDNPTPFLALSAKWSAEITPQAKLTVSLRASANNNDWSEWQPSSLDGDPRTQTGLFFFPSTSKFIQYRVEMERDGKRNSPLIKNIKFRFISPGTTPKNDLEDLNNQAGRKITRRKFWACPDVSNIRPKLQRSKITHLIVHHTATSNDAKDWPAMVRCIWNFHAYTNGWRDLGYHFLIDPNGVIYEGRAGEENVIGSHFSCANSGTVGIAMLGNFMTESPSPKALQSLESLLARECAKLRLQPEAITYHASTRLKLPVIAGHRDANDAKVTSVCAGTKCPGDKLYALLPEIRAGIKNIGFINDGGTSFWR